MSDAHVHAPGQGRATARLLVKLSWRSLWRNRRRTQITLSSIGLGLSLAIFLGSLSEGLYEKAVRDATQLLSGQLTVEMQRYNDNPGPALALSGAPALRERLASIPGVLRVRPVVSAQAVASSGAGSVGVGIIGVDPQVERGSSPLESKLVAGKLLDPSEPRGLLIGVGLAKRLRLEPGKKLVLTATDVQGNVSSELFRVSGIFRLGSAELDTYAAQGQLPLVRKLLGLREDQVGQLGLFVRADEGVQASVQRAARELAGPLLAVRTWEETMPALAAWIALDRKSGEVMRGLIVFLVMFTILNTLLMSVLERGHEFAVLLALGTPRFHLEGQVLLEVAMLAVLGCTLGSLLGSLAALFGQVHGIDLSTLAPIGMTAGGMALDPIIHCKLTALSLAKQTGLVFGATILLGLGPMRRARNVELAGSLRTQR
jgi:putative ABC transport system permease protein